MLDPVPTLSLWRGAPRRPGARAALALTALALAVGGCKPDPYAMPDAPPRDSWVSLNSVDAEDPQAAIMRYLEARGVAIALYSALRDEAWEDALRLMSQETRNFLELGGGGDAIAALENGAVTLRGQTTPFVPADMFFIDDLARIEDSVPAAPPESETEKRKELYAVSTDGRARKVVFIYEADAWRLHSPFFNPDVFEAGAP